MPKHPVTKTYVREQVRAARDYLRELTDELAKRDPDWSRIAELANVAGGHAQQIASDIEMAEA